MKKSILIISIIIFAFSCKKDCPNEDKEIPVKLPFTCEIPDGFSIIAKDSVVVSVDDIYFYDWARHKIYLKKLSPFVYDIVRGDTFYVCADGELIYEGIVITAKDYYNIKPFIYNEYPKHPGSIFTADTVISIISAEKDTSGYPRWDERIIRTLRTNDIYRILEEDMQDTSIHLSGEWINNINDTLIFKVFGRYTIEFKAHNKFFEWYSHFLKGDSIFLHSNLYSSYFLDYKSHYFKYNNNEIIIENFQDFNNSVYHRN